MANIQYPRPPDQGNDGQLPRSPLVERSTNEPVTRDVVAKMTASLGGGAHASTHENGGSDEINVAGLSGVLADAQTPAAHAHDGSEITTGTVAPARLGSGSGGSTLFLREDSTWQAVGGGSTPTGTGFVHITGGVQDGASKLVDTADINNSQVTFAKLQDVSATDRLLGRSTAGPGVVEEITCTSAGRALLDDANAAAQRTTLGLVIGSNVLAQYAEADNLFGTLLGSGIAGVFWTDGLGSMAIVDLGTANPNDVLSWDGAALKWVAPAGGSTPTGTGFTHITAGVQDAAAKLVDTADVNDDQITFAKMQNATAASVLVGRRSGSTGDFEQIELGSGLTMTAAVLSVGAVAAADVSYSPGSFTVLTETANLRSRKLKLVSTQRATLQGTATLRIS